MNAAEALKIYFSWGWRLRSEKKSYQEDCFLGRRVMLKCTVAEPRKTGVQHGSKSLRKAIVHRDTMEMFD